MNARQPITSTEAQQVKDALAEAPADLTAREQDRDRPALNRFIDAGCLARTARNFHDCGNQDLEAQARDLCGSEIRRLRQEHCNN